ncbi:DNA-binding transcriptional regulator, MerR family [Streptomyces sp. di188]|nr:DNA-binding transcriptional regulator, MerR family [Streptomyces sp. di50b]SCD68566.1 DNA-binding transcriptional regulator, MerR family [Streptomyces sp. di188]
MSVVVTGRTDRPVTENADVDEELLSIGAFAARSRLSAKALRLYDRLGLLAPARVDADTGYRYYRAGQVERARLVALLRQLDMPLARIAEVVDAGDGAAQAARLDAYWAEVEARHAARRTLADHLRGRLSGRSLEMYGKFTVETVDVPEQVVLTESRHILADELPAWIGASLGRLEEGARACGGVTGSPFVVYHSEVSVESDGPAEACVPVADEAAARAWAAERGRARGTTVRVEPAMRLAGTRITKAQVAHPQILSAFEAVEAWMRERGLTYAGPCREIYFADWDAAGPSGPGVRRRLPGRGGAGDRGLTTDRATRRAPDTVVCGRSRGLPRPVCRLPVERAGAPGGREPALSARTADSSRGPVGGAACAGGRRGYLTEVTKALHASAGNASFGPSGILVSPSSSASSVVDLTITHAPLLLV